MLEIVITNAKRTPISRFCGSLKNLSAVDMASQLASKMLAGLNIKNHIDSVVLGMARQVDADPARKVQINCGGVPLEKTAYTLNMACGSSLCVSGDQGFSALFGRN